MSFVLLVLAVAVIATGTAFIAALVAGRRRNTAQIPRAVEKPLTRPCPSCGAHIGTHETSCPVCSNRVSARTLLCPKCGMHVGAVVRFCKRCHTRMVA